jgi:hypothetical protein
MCLSDRCDWIDGKQQKFKSSFDSISERILGVIERNLQIRIMLCYAHELRDGCYTPDEKQGSDEKQGYT